MMSERKKSISIVTIKDGKGTKDDSTAEEGDDNGEERERQDSELRRVPPKVIEKAKKGSESLKNEHQQWGG